jgi:glutamine amidotransferase
MGGRDVVIIDSGGANIASLQFALERLDTPAALSADPARIKNASHVILPGVGAAAHAMQRLREAGLHTLIPSLERPVLGICLGMQLLFESSEEGQAECLGIIPGRAARFQSADERPVPHMGWNTVNALQANPLLEGVRSGDYAYFVHSYALGLSAATIASCEYGAPFSACVQWRNFFGAQFHPERSAALGAQVLRTFLDIQ